MTTNAALAEVKLAGDGRSDASVKKRSCGGVPQPVAKIKTHSNADTYFMARPPSCLESAIQDAARDSRRAHGTTVRHVRSRASLRSLRPAAAQRRRAYVRPTRAPCALRSSPD